MSRGLEGTSRDLELLRVFQHQDKGKNYVVWKSSHNTIKATSFQFQGQQTSIPSLFRSDLMHWRGRQRWETE